MEIWGTWMACLLGIYKWGQLLMLSIFGTYTHLWILLLHLIMVTDQVMMTICSARSVSSLWKAYLLAWFYAIENLKKHGLLDECLRFDDLKAALFCHFIPQDLLRRVFLTVKTWNASCAGSPVYSTGYLNIWLNMYLKSVRVM